MRGITVIELGSGANTQVVPKEEDKGPPEGFIDNTVKVYRLNPDGSKGEHLRDMPVFPEDWDKPEDFTFSVNAPKQRGEDSMAKYDWVTLWPQVQELQAAGKNAKEIAVELEIDLSVLNAKIYREKKAKDVKKSGMTINPEFEAAVQEAEKTALKQTPDPEPEKVGRQDPVQEAQEPAADSVPNAVPAVNMPLGCELPKYTEEDFGPADDEPIPYVVVPTFDLAPVKIQLIATALAEYRDERMPADITLELVRAIGDIELGVK